MPAGSRQYPRKPCPGVHEVLGHGPHDRPRHRSRQGSSARCAAERPFLSIADFARWFLRQRYEPLGSQMAGSSSRSRCPIEGGRHPSYQCSQYRREDGAASLSGNRPTGTQSLQSAGGERSGKSGPWGVFRTGIEGHGPLALGPTRPTMRRSSSPICARSTRTPEEVKRTGNL